jgi:hypothetical protein
MGSDHGRPDVRSTFCDNGAAVTEEERPCRANRCDFVPIALHSGSRGHR